MGTTIFEHMSALARERGAINLGQGFPDDGYAGESPLARRLQAAAARAMIGQSQQYPPSPGLAVLRAGLAAHYSARGPAVLPAGVIVTSGATEAIAAAILALVSPGNEVLLFAPAYDAYAPLVRRAGGVAVIVPLRPPGWAYDEAAIHAAITPRTRAMIVNDPLNPLGTVASAEELAMLARLCTAHDLVAICDEVWEGVRFDGHRHRSLAAQPGMAGRAVKIGSAGKLFGLTGWKVGWAIAGEALAALVGRAHQFLTFTTPPALQFAVAEGLAYEIQLFTAQHDQWTRSRSRLIDGLREAGFVVADNAATWFVCIDLAASGIGMSDTAFAQHAIDAGVATIPVSALYEAPHPPTHLLRLCFTKPDVVLDTAVLRLSAARGGTGAGG
ncbi:MAG: aminotransferase class I/II-fold pyridoxal phosphate-dependent enzyme [Sphingomonadales bacterium]|nr:aminotransferase class I/II-fold pyridoxal phosphate-dependent enzyme [Sphingomonadales bacterium]